MLIFQNNVHFLGFLYTPIKEKCVTLHRICENVLHISKLKKDKTKIIVHRALCIVHCALCIEKS